MSIDLGTPALEVAIGLAFVFFLFSLIVSAATEAIAWGSKQRARTLVKGIERLLGDEKASRAVLDHPLVQSDVTTPPSKRKPSYVSSRNFALALDQTLRRGHREEGSAIGQLRAGVDAHPADSALGAQLRALLDEAGESAERFRAGVERWFDDAMDRVSGWYKRWSQAVAILIAVVLSVGLNVDAIRVAERLSSDQGLRQTVVAQAEARAEKRPTGSEAKAGEGVSSAFQEVQDLNLPILWGSANSGFSLATVVGWLITAAAISLGAPFWFDALGKLAHLKTSGKKPPAPG